MMLAWFNSSEMMASSSPRKRLETGRRWRRSRRCKEGWPSSFCAVELRDLPFQVLVQLLPCRADEGGTDDSTVAVAVSKSLSWAAFDDRGIIGQAEGSCWWRRS